MIKKIDNIPVNYIEAGEGDAVLLLHGWGANITLYQGIIDTLKRTRRVIALDMPGLERHRNRNGPGVWMITWILSCSLLHLLS